ncbi:hypothetical protein Tco_0134601 [Tanacetum coccineum]
MSSNSTSNTNGAVNTALGATTASTQATAVNSTTIDNLSDAIICAFFASQPNSLQLNNEDLQQIHPDDLEEMDLRWQMAMVTMSDKGDSWKKIAGSFSGNGTESIGFDKSKNTRKVVPVETTTSNTLILCDGLGDYDWSDQAEEGLESVEARILVYKKNESVYEDDIKVLKQEFMDEPIVREPTVKKPITENSEAKASEAKPKEVRKNNGAPIIEDWMSDSEDEA